MHSCAGGSTQFILEARQQGCKDMNVIHRTQKGGSVVSLIITLIVVGIGAYIAIQVIPQRIEAGTMDNILDEIKRDHQLHPVNNMNQIQSSIEKQLNVNEMNDMKGNIEVESTSSQLNTTGSWT
jgi:hypothetical protein